MAAPSGRLRTQNRAVFGAVSAVLIATGLLFASAPANAAAPPQLWQKCTTGSGAGQCQLPRGVAVDPDSGHLFFAEQSNNRISEFTAWGEFVRAWGWDVAPEGASGDTPEDQFEVCVSENGDVCKAGTEGDGAGQLGQPFAGPQGVAVDSGGDVYVVDWGNRRVQKFSISEGSVEFELMIGGEVNQTKSEESGSTEAERNLCTAASGDVCQTGVEGSGQGQFGLWPVGSYISVFTNATTTTADDTLYVGDVNRIQKFDTDGSYAGQIPFSGGPLPEPGTVGALAVDNAPAGPNFGDLYFSYDSNLTPPPSNARCIQPDVHRLDPITGNEVGTLEIDCPGALAIDSEGNVHVFAKRVFVTNGDPNNKPVRIMGFDFAGNQTDIFDAEQEGFDDSTGIATSSACGLPSSSLYVANSNFSNSFVRAYGTAPTDIEACPPPAAAPDITGQFALDVGIDEATFKAQINPHFWSDTTYYLQYGTDGPCSANPCQAQPAAPGDTLTNQVIDAEFPVSVELSGLDPDTTYHYRFIAQSSGGGPAFGPDRSITTFAEPSAPGPCPNDEFRLGTPSQNLPDCRAFEMVSPLDKNGGDAFQGKAVGNLGALDKIDQATPDGEALTYSSYRAFAGAQGGAWTNQYLARRSAEGWGTEPLTPPLEGPNFYDAQWYLTFQAFSPDLCTAFFLNPTESSLAVGDVSGFPDLYRRDNCGGAGFSALTTLAPPTLPADNFQSGYGDGLAYYPRVQGFSADGQAVFFRANDRLTPDGSGATDTNGNPIFQTYVKTPTALRLVSVLPSPSGGVPGGAAPEHSSLGTHFGRSSTFQYDNLHGAVSADGSRVFWTTTGAGAVPNGDGGPGRLYVRINSDRAQSPVSGGQCTRADRACTVAVSESVDPGNARFESATPSGSEALFRFVSGAHAGELYSFDADKAVAYQPGPATLIAGGVTGLLGASEDLSHVYFVSTQVLDSGAVSGRANLYLYEQGEGIGFIGTLVGGEGTGAPSGFPNPLPASDLPWFRTSRISADGSIAVFTSRAPLTGYDNADAASGEPAVEVFRYDAQADQLHCVSCNPSGSRPTGKPDANKVVWFAATIPGWEYSLHASRVLSADGNRLFFNSYDALDPRDTNGKSDVYQWQAPGTGDCDTSDPGFHAQNGGCLSLITTGQSDDDSEFVNASADGSDVFVRSREQLHASDTDELLDIYDARTAGGFPPPAISQAPCDLNAGACEGKGSESPAGSGAGSAVFEGRGNPPRRWQGRKACPKGKRKVVRKGRARCVAKKRKPNNRSAVR